MCVLAVTGPGVVRVLAFHCLAEGRCYRAPETDIILHEPPKGHYVCTDCTVRFAVLYVGVRQSRAVDV